MTTGVIKYNPACLQQIRLEDGRVIGVEGAKAHLKNVFGHEEFRPGQWAVITHGLSGEGNVLIVKPTGAGKTFPISFLGSLPQRGYTLMIIPCTSLMLEQTAALRGKGARVACPNADNYDGRTEAWQKRYWAEVCAEASFGRLNFLILSPERMVKNPYLKKWWSALFSLPLLGLVFIDEIHLVCSWGTGLRPMLDMRRVGGILSKEVRMIGATATITSAMMKDVCIVLRFEGTGTVFWDLNDRPNLRIQVHQLWNRKRKEVRMLLQNQMINGLVRLGGKAVLYSGTKQDCEDLFALLNLICREKRNGMIVKSKVYHSNTKTRPEIGKDWQSGALNVIIATTAFGLGVDTPDIRQVIFECCPFGMVDYSQQMGRGGRDGKHCVIETYVTRAMF